ncbi:hypothetical protein SK128_028297 [Halocaridina rubra]|uniref:Peptidase S1 domain-containing protein n=1 Tax=Halocaridina rubra TaxID=373956 RepID=A0AAN8WZB3_HALRR
MKQKKGMKKKGKQKKQRSCTKTTKKCRNSRGVCVSKKQSSCATVPIDSLCLGGCTCCIGRAYAKCQCGQELAARIVGGSVVSPEHKYPWMVSLRQQNSHFCGGSLINDRYVLTAAHCVYVPKSKLKSEIKSTKVALGDFNINSKADDIAKVTQKVDIKDIIIHENYNDKFNDDIALVKLKVPLDLTAYDEIKPVCLPSNRNQTYEDYDAIVMGWGMQDYDDWQSTAEELMEVNVPILSPKCPGKIPNKFDITENMLCAGYKKGGKDACNGDSGGPLVVKEGSSFVQVGIVSFGFDCALPNTPGIYTRVTQYIDWIAENTKDALSCA